MATITWKLHSIASSGANSHNFYKLVPLIDGVEQPEAVNLGIDPSHQFTSFDFDFTIVTYSHDSLLTILTGPVGNASATGMRATLYTGQTVARVGGQVHFVGSVDAAGLATLNAEIATGTFTGMTLYARNVGYGRTSSQAISNGNAAAAGVSLLPAEMAAPAVPVEFATTPATASALMTDATVEAEQIDPDFTFDATPATATAMAGDHEVNIGIYARIKADAMSASGTMEDVRWTRAVRALSPRTFMVSGGNIVERTSFQALSYTGTGYGATTPVATYYAELPDANSLNAPTGSKVNQEKFILHSNTPGTYPVSYKVRVRVVRLNGPSEIHSYTLYESSWLKIAAEHVIPLDGLSETELLAIDLIKGSSDYATIGVDNPANDSPVGSHLIMSVQTPLVTLVESGEPATADAMMNDASTLTGRGISRNAPAATASAELLEAIPVMGDSFLHQAAAAEANAEMPGGYFADFTFTAAPADATARMGAAWFRSGRRVYVEGAAEALGEALDDVQVYRNENDGFEAEVATASGFARDPESVNGQDINNDLYDPYWNRVTRRSTEGYLPPATVQWFRFNERSGNKAHAFSPSGVKGTAFDITGVFEQGVSGINNRNSLSVANAGVDVANDVVNNEAGNRPYGGSLEFSVRIAPGHTGRMDIVNGRERDGMTSQVNRRLHVSVRDGRLYASTSYGGTSMRRIDDGKWHHIVITTEPNTNGRTSTQTDVDLQFYIDGKLDRTLANEENGGSTTSSHDPRDMARPTDFFGQDTGYAFRGEIMEFVFRTRYLQSHEVMDLYLDLFGYKAVRATPATGEATITKDNRVVSNMKRMLVLTWAEPYTYQDNTPDYFRGHAPKYARSLYAPRFGKYLTANPKYGVDKDPQLSPMLGYGYDEEMDIGRYQLIYQDVSYIDTATNEEARRKYAQGTTADVPIKSNLFRDDATGERRFVNLQSDIDLDDYEVIAFQAYPNPSYKDQAERLRYEAFFNSVNTALADGHKVWITDAYLAADLGWVSRVDEVPVLNQEINGIVSNRGRKGLDVRGYEVFPFDQSVPGFAKDGITPVTKPADGSMPELPKGRPRGSQVGEVDVWDFDVHQNNGYRVLNEIAGLTDLPSWELAEMGLRSRREIFNDRLEHGRWAYKMENRTGETFTWERQYTDNSLTGGGKPVGEKYNFAKPAKGRGLKAGEEFYDYTWFEEGNAYFTYAGSASYATAEEALLRRVGRTWAVPHGALRIGTPVTTFRSTQWNDFGDEVVNPWRNHIRNAVVRPGDRLPDGRKVKGYAYMEFAEHPVWDEIAGIGVQKQLTFGVGMDPFYGYAPARHDADGIAPESNYTFDWDYVRGIGRSTFSGGGMTTDSRRLTLSWDRDKTGALVPVMRESNADTLPIAQKVRSIHPVEGVPHLTWNARGLAWLLMVDTVDAEFSNTAASVATGQGSMLEANVSTEFDNVVSVGAAQAVGTIVAPEEAQVKEVNVQTFAATASAMMNGLQGGYKAEAAIGFADMFQGVKRPLDIEEVLFFTLSMNQETIYVRMEEN